MGMEPAIPLGLGMGTVSFLSMAMTALDVTCKLVKAETLGGRSGRR